MSALFTFFLALIVSWTLSFTTAAQAGWFGKDKKEQASASEIVPPPEGTIEENCGEIRRKIGEINSSNAFKKTLSIPRREWLLSRNKRCMAQWGQQEFDYLRQVEVTPKAAQDAETPDETTEE